jgi:hypothetical protein
MSDDLFLYPFVVDDVFVLFTFAYQKKKKRKILK